MANKLPWADLRPDQQPADSQTDDSKLTPLWLVQYTL